MTVILDKITDKLLVLKVRMCKRVFGTSDDYFKRRKEKQNKDKKKETHKSSEKPKVKTKLLTWKKK